MRRWPSPTIDGTHCNSTGLAPSHSTSPPLPVNLPDHEPYDYESHLDRLAAEVDRMSRRWPSTSVTTTAAIDPSPTMTDWPARCKFSSLHPTATNFPRRPVTISTPTIYVPDRPNPTATTNFVEMPQHCPTAGDDSDPPLLAAVISLDKFLMKYPRPTDSAVATYQIYPDRRLLPSRHDRLAQQTQVLCTMNVILGELSAKISRFIDAFSGVKQYTIAMQPKLPPRNPSNPTLPAPRLPTKTVRTSQHSIPAKPPFTRLHSNLTMHRTKENLRPP